ncbi:MAG: 3-isopropylmalate dehydratase small subunit [Actinomycetota bacterium]|nr:3-isopropylmalate dehydratase small subunit [Actinomycetota bacterium]
MVAFERNRKCVIARPDPPVLKGTARVFGDDINTDYIISGRYKFKTLDMGELAKHVMEDLEPGFADRIDKGDFIVAGRNFGCGSSREQAPLALKAAGISAVIARSFARIFFRNAINNGLPLLICDTSGIDDSDILEVDIGNGLVRDLTKDSDIKCEHVPGIMLTILDEGGLVSFIQKHGKFRV